MDSNQECDPGSTIKEEEIDDVVVDCKTDVELLDDGTGEDQCDYQLDIKEETGDIDDDVKVELVGNWIVADELDIRAGKDSFATNDSWCDDPDTGRTSKGAHSLDNLRFKSNSQFACDFCSHHSSGKVGLKEHMKIHTIQKPNVSQPLSSLKKTLGFNCDICKFSTRNKQLLKRHIKVHMGEKPYACEICDYRTLDKCSLKQHMLVHTNDKPYACEMCDHRTKSLPSLKNHIMARHAVRKPYNCNICVFSSGYKRHLQQHIMIHTGEKPFACERCSYRASYKSSVKTHMLRHHRHTSLDSNPGPIIKYAATKQSEKVLTFNKKNSNDVQIAKQDGLFVCHDCDYSAHTKVLVKRHIMMRHLGVKPYYCGKCDYRCSRMARLRDHMMLHTGEKRYVCDICEYRSITRAHLKEHLKLHTGNRKYKDVTTSTSSQQFRCHYGIAHGDMPFSCKACDYSAGSKTDLNAHMMTHNSLVEKQFHCDYCTYRTKDLTRMKNHVMVHTGERPFACSICNYRARQKGVLKTHMLRHTGEKPYTCDYCTYRSSQKINVKFHLKSCPGNKPKSSGSLESNGNQPNDSCSNKKPGSPSSHSERKCEKRGRKTSTVKGLDVGLDPQRVGSSYSDSTYSFLQGYRFFC